MRALLITLGILAARLGAVSAFADGGPGPQRPQPGTLVYAPVVERWTFLSSGLGTDVGGILCDDARPCDASALDAAAAAGHTCAADTRLWLATASREDLVLRDINILISVVAWSGGGEIVDGVRNSSVSSTEFAVPWDDGWWWRQEAQRLEIAFPAACDTRVASVSVNVRARELDGDARTAAQTAELVLVPPDG